MKGVFYGFMEIYKTFSRLWYPHVSTVTPKFFLILTAANWIMITPIYKPQREKKRRLERKEMGIKMREKY